MPCDTPPPPSPVDDHNQEGDDIMYDGDDGIEDDFEVIEEIDDLGIIDIEEDDSLITFNGHKQPVFCCNFDRTGDYIVTGGQDDTAFVWSVQSKTIKFECTGHSESVIAASFSPDSKYVATADMNGLVQLWNMDDGSLEWNFEAYEIQWLLWLKGENSFIAGGSDGSCWKWTVPAMDTNVFPNANASCCTGSITHDDKKLVTGYTDGTLKLWNISNNKLSATLSGASAHKEAITTIKFNADNTLILTGSEDGTAKVIKASDFKVLWTLNGCDNGDSIQHEHENVSVEDVAFCHSLPYIAIGTNCGTLSFWDFNTKTRRALTECNSSIIRIISDKITSQVYVAIGDGTIQAHDARTGDVVKYWHGHKAAILDLDLSSDCRLLLTASDDNTCKIFQRDNP